jgi:hypothetical protein
MEPRGGVVDGHASTAVGSSARAPKLVDFDPRDWPSLEAWSDARFAWLLDHPDRTIDGIDAVDVVNELEY